MGVANEIAVIAIAVIFNYLVLYRNNKLLGNVGFMLTGLALMSYSSSSDINNGIGLFMMLGSFGNLIYDYAMGLKKTRY